MPRGHSAHPTSKQQGPTTTITGAPVPPAFLFRTRAGGRPKTHVPVCPVSDFKSLGFGRQAGVAGSRGSPRSPKLRGAGW